MCGIVGALAFDGSNFEVTTSYVTRMRDTMIHRGPDGSGVWIDGDAHMGLGHRRLTIIDLSDCARQPMSNEDDSLWITFNGEIYNHADVRRELIRLGVRSWKTDHSDTEVVLKAFARWGIGCLGRFRGMFAFAIWDKRNRELWLVRDRIGIKPLYYSVHHGRITFASEIKALLQDPDQPRRVNERSLFHYLSFLTCPAPETFFDGIMKLEPSTFLHVKSDGQMTQHRYWDVWDHTEPLLNASDNEIAERVIAELRTAVSLHKVGDVAVGLALSGVIDSSTNTSLFAEGETQDVNTFTIGYDAEYDSSRNEFEQARVVANLFNTKHHERLLSLEDLLSFLPEMIRLQDEPIGDPVCIPLYYLAHLARQNGVKVCQLGEGADELFCGYPSWNIRLALQRYDDLPLPRVLKKAGLSMLAAAGKSDEYYYEYLRRGSLGQPIFWSGSETYPQHLKEKLLSDRLNRMFDGYTSWEAIAPVRQRFLEKAWDTSHLHWMTYSDLSFRLPELLLMRVDKMGMGTSVEGRVPFLDHKFVELVMSIPTEVKTRNRELKYILKKAVRGVIPDEIIDRKKQGFGVPIDEWIAEELGDYAAKELRTFCNDSDLLAWPEIERLLKDPRRRAGTWTLLNVALWWKEYIQ